MRGRRRRGRNPSDEKPWIRTIGHIIGNCTRYKMGKYAADLHTLVGNMMSWANEDLGWFKHYEPLSTGDMRCQDLLRKIEKQCRDWMSLRGRRADIIGEILLECRSTLRRMPRY